MGSQSVTEIANDDTWLQPSEALPQLERFYRSWLSHVIRSKNHIYPLVI